MKDMIDQIISTDKKSRESVARTKQLRLESQQKISDMREQKRNEYLERARTNIRAMEQEEKVKADAKLREIENNYRQAEARIDKIYKDSREAWINEIVSRVTKG